MFVYWDYMLSKLSRPCKRSFQLPRGNVGLNYKPFVSFNYQVSIWFCLDSTEIYMGLKGWEAKQEVNVCIKYRCFRNQWFTNTFSLLDDYRNFFFFKFFLIQIYFFLISNQSTSTYSTLKFYIWEFIYILLTVSLNI